MALWSFLVIQTVCFVVTASSSWLPELTEDVHDPSISESSLLLGKDRFTGLCKHVFALVVGR